MTADLAGKVAWITGGAQGFGAAVARRLASHGAQVVVSDVKREAGEATAAEVGGAFVECDVSSFEACQAAVAQVLQLHGRLDIAFLNAGITTGCGVADDFDPARYRRAMGVNIDGVVYGAHAAFAALRADGGGDLIATASLAGLTGTAFDPIYGANKHAVVGLVRAIGDDWPSHGIRVNAICPGFADTEIVNDIRPMLDQMGIPLIKVESVVDAFMAALSSGRSAECWYIQPGREPEPFRFRGIPGPRLQE
ncbi:MAG TPA: SDR family oxidoreductase [Mycobacteriales bacterium]|nr:SDR family oxidoreductase [Mycobacteriales bacterium]